MQTIERCPVTELLRDQCACRLCRNIPDPPKRRLGRPFTAEFAGRCSDCDEPFAAGDRIARDGDSYVGPCCLEVEADG